MLKYPEYHAYGQRHMQTRHVRYRLKHTVYLGCQVRDTLRTHERHSQRGSHKEALTKKHMLRTNNTCQDSLSTLCVGVEACVLYCMSVIGLSMCLLFARNKDTLRTTHTDTGTYRCALNTGYVRTQGMV